MLSPIGVEIAINLSAGWGAGILIGLERTYNGRAAGFRTHALVGLAAAATAAIAYQPMVLSAGGALGAHPMDASRLAQGVMTGIGFLGAGVIFKEGVSVQGLTTAASIWVTAAVGLLFGIGMFWAGIAATVIVLVTLVALRWLENIAPWRVYALAIFRFESAQAPTEEGLEELMSRFSVSVSDVSYKLLKDGQIFEYWTNLETRRQDAYRHLAEHLRTIPGLVEYEVSRISK